MKLIAALIFIAFAASVYAVSCTTLVSENSCEFSGCYWCERCFNNEGNTFGQNICVQSNGDCLYQPSMVCGSECETNNNCPILLNESADICRYNGFCSAGSCNYVTEYCPSNGTLSGNTCYFGKRECSSSGCSIDSCTLSASQICDPSNGCVSCGQEDCGTNGDFLENYECVGADVYAERVVYQCNATECLFSRSDEQIETCTNGCFEGVCNAPLCNFNGLIRDCNALNGFAEQPYCKNNDIYRVYRNYFCGASACEYNISDKLIQDCPESCLDAKCVAGQVVEVDIDNAPDETPAEEPQGQVARGYSGDVYNGWLFGNKRLEIETTPGTSGTLMFDITDANMVHDLKMTTNGNEILVDRPGKGSYSVNFENAGNKIIISAESSGWIFFLPNFYHITKAYVVYQ